MKQFNYEFTDAAQIENALQEVYGYTSSHKYSKILFHLYSMLFDDDMIRDVQHKILDVFSDACICGTSSNGDICDGHLVDCGMVMAVSVFETTDIRTYLFECAEGQETAIGTGIKDIIDGTDKIKAAEILITLKTINSHKILDEVEKCRKDVELFGGGSAGTDIADTNTKVMNEKTVSHNAVMLVTYSGDDFNIDVHHAIGWKPLGKDLTATRIEGKRLYELDGVPAASVYSKYLDIQPGDDFFSNMLEFPIMSQQHGNNVLRLPFSCDSSDGSIILAADLNKGTTVNLSYGDPDVIRGDVEELHRKVQDFAPQAVFLYSCGVRRLYWKYLINKETGPFSSIAPVSGFYSSGEIMRMGGFAIEHHVTLIAISMREGGHAALQPTGIGDKEIATSDEQKMHGQISMVRRLATFINVTAAELREANEVLQQMADTDALTGLNNRRVIDKLVRTAFEHSDILRFDLTVGILDVDDFKLVNDTYGHAIGDKVLVTIAKILNEELSKIHNTFLGRWGGEEFLFIIPRLSLDETKEFMENIRKRIESTTFEEVGHKTISIGMTQYVGGDTADDVFERADSALYEAKGTGKNKLCIKLK